MSVLNRISSLFKPRVVVYDYRDPAVSVDGIGVADLYATQPHLRSVVEFLARNIAQLPLKVYVRESDDRRLRDVDSPAALLLRKPNPTMTGYELIFATVASLKLYDRALWVYGRDADTESGWSIYLVPIEWVSQYGGGDAFEPEWVEFTNDDRSGERVRVDRGQFMLFHGYSPTSPRYGISPVEALKTTLSEQLESQEYRRQVWQRGGRIPAYISRPKDAPGWTDSAFARFKRDMQANFSGKGSKAGSYPILEDGMEIKTSEFNARDAQWVEGIKLSLETCCEVYHVNPAMIGSNEGQTYASVKDNARALYADTLGPDLRMITERINLFLLPAIGADKRAYCEFDVNVKMRGSFEEETAAIQSSIGAPWRTRNEGRALQGLPPIDGGDELITPLNVLIGGQASPTDSAAPPLSHDPEIKSRERKARSKPPNEDIDPYRKALKRFFARQRKSVLPKIGASGKSVAPDWWDEDRWNKELADDLMDAILAGSVAAAKRALDALGLPESAYSTERTEAFLRSVAEVRAKWINAATLRQLIASLDGEYSEDAAKADPEGVFDEAESTRADSAAVTLATTIAGWATIEAGKQLSGSGAVKTWETHSHDPRRSHMRMDGQTVPIDKPFSNGAYWPGDSKHLRPEDVSNCKCTVTVTIPGD